ncbi:MAG TPA: nucleotidyltransferase family protein, partial [Solirubrobacterales bacterium]|nr:nucleotidyltransferase family protein [Solirubrobacterales bacterium]
TEHTLLLRLACGTAADGDHCGARGLTTPGLDWARLLGVARAHEVTPLVGRNLERLGFAGVPPAIRAELQADRRSTAAHNALLVRELVRVLRLLDGARIPTIPIKGVALAETLYGDPTLRVCSDIDVLVPRARAREALRLLRADGYAAEFNERFFETLLLRRHIEYTLTRRTRGVQYVLDLHWGISWCAWDDRRAADALWAESRPVSRWGVQTHAMTPEWELLTLAVHAARHGWRPLKWLVDVHDYCASRPLHGQKLRDTAERFGWLLALQQTLGACRMLFDTVPPSGVAPVMPERWDPGLAEQVGAASPEALLPLRLIGLPSAKVRYLVQLLLVPTLAERRLVRLPSSLGLLYYPLRPMRLASKWGWRAFGRRARAAFRSTPFPL